jgi:hypothetical protein
MMLQRFLLVWLTLLSVLAFLWPHCAAANVEPFTSIVDPFVATKDSLQYLFAVTMFAIGCLLPRDEVRQVIRRWPTVLAGTAIQYSLMPLLANELMRLMLAEQLFAFITAAPVEMPTSEVVPVAGTNNEGERTFRSAAEARQTGRTSKTLRGARRRTIVLSVP